MANQFGNSVVPYPLRDDGEEAKQDESNRAVMLQFAIPQSANLHERLLHLNDVCLEKIFSYLNYDDLVNVVLYDKQFKSTVKKVFLRKHWKEYVVLSNIDPLDSTEMDRSIQLLNLFGDAITNLCISFKLENIGYLINVVKQRCGKNIRKLKLDHAKQKREKWQRHEHGTISINELLKCINKIFPNLHEFHLIYGDKTDVCPYWYDVDEMVIPSLTNFTIDGRFVFEIFKKFIGLNPSIENLCVRCQCSDFKWNIGYDFVPLLDNALPKLKYLEMSVACHVPYQQFDHCNPIYLQQLKKFKSVGHMKNVWIPNFYQFAGNELVELDIDELKLEQESFIDSISHFKQLTQITIETVGPFSTEQTICLENDINGALANKEPIKIIVRRNELSRYFPQILYHANFVPNQFLV